MGKINKMLALLLLGLIVFSPVSAFAASGDIFTIISNKMITTIQDVRKIVYIIAGFGLIMFAVLAVFNKISFKHLSYIMIGLSLLSVMMPFINYFSGANLEDSEYSYENFIAGGDASITGSDLGDLTECTGAICPDGLEGGLGDNNGLAGLPNGLLDDLKSDLPDLDLANITTPYDKNGCRTVNGEQDCCEGTVKNGQCKKSFKQTFKDIAETAKNIIAGGKSIVGAVDSGINAVNAAKEGMDNIGDIISGDGNVFDKLGGLAGTVGSTIGSITGGTAAAMGGLGSALGYAGAAGDVIKGDDSTSSAIDNSGVGDALDVIGSGANDVGNEVRDFTSTTEDLAGYGNQAVNMGEKVKDWFGRK